MSFQQYSIDQLWRMQIASARANVVDSYKKYVVPPTLHNRTLFSVTTPIAGGQTTLLAALTNRVRKLIGGYIRQTAGAARNFQLQHFDGTNARPISDNDTGSKALRDEGNLLDTTGEVIRVDGAAAADEATYQGVIYHDDIGFPPRV